MKISLKISLFLLSLFFVVTVFAQKYSLEAGFVKPKQFGTHFSTTNFNGIRLGGNAEFDLKNNFSLLTGALYSVVYSNKIQYYSYSDSVRYQTYGHSIDIPLQLNYSLPIAKNLKIFGYAGPTINIGLAQPRKTTAVLSTSLVAINEALTGNPIVNGTDDLYKKAIISRMNFQLGAGGGIQWKNYKLKAGYDFGIKSINAVDTNNMYQSGWHVSLVYEF